MLPIKSLEMVDFVLESLCGNKKYSGISSQPNKLEMDEKAVNQWGTRRERLRDLGGNVEKG